MQWNHPTTIKRPYEAAQVIKLQAALPAGGHRTTAALPAAIRSPRTLLDGPNDA
jgi:hypothetical protein